MTRALDEEVKGRGDDKSLGVEQVYDRVWTRVRWVSLGVGGVVPEYANNVAAVAGSLSALAQKSRAKVNNAAAASGSLSALAAPFRAIFYNG